jgi:hypothetical protein
MVLGVSTAPGLGDPWGRFSNSAGVRKKKDLSCWDGGRMRVASPI